MTPIFADKNQFLLGSANERPISVISVPFFCAIFLRRAVE